MWLGNESSNLGTNSQPARIAETLKTRTLVTSPTYADYLVKGPRTLAKGVQVPTHSSISHINSKVPNLGRQFPATTTADRGGGELERKKGSVVVPTGPVLLNLEVCGGDSAKWLRWR
ncbi:unnamed protein product, partial [Prunus brigantina]